MTVVRRRFFCAVLLALLATLVVLPPAPAAAVQAYDRTSPPTSLVRPDFVTARAHTARGAAPVVVPGAALPFGYYVDRRLAERFGAGAVVAAMGQWDGIPGSRWSTRYLGLVEPGAARAAVDGRSVVFLEDACGAQGGYAYRQMDTAVRDEAYGAVGVYVNEVDIGVCPGVSGQRPLRSVLGHEVGHAMGLDHLCDPGADCWRPGMGPGPHACRVMYHGQAACRPEVSQRDHDAARHLYPTLPRLAGPGREETAARASYATAAVGSARTVVVARSDQTAHGPLAAAALAGALDAPLLLARSSAGTCLTGPGLEELGRVARAYARVLLVGDWPSSCGNALLLRTYNAERIRGAGAARLSVAVADRLSRANRLSGAAVLVSAAVDASGNVPDGVAGGAAAGAARGPVLYTARSSLPGAVGAWLAEHPQVRRVYVLGGPAVVSDEVLGQVRRLGAEPVRLAGPDRVTTALALASRTELFPPGSPVMVAGAGAWPDAVAASALGGRLRAPVVITHPGADPRVVEWLRLHRADRGYVVGGPAAVPFATQWAYSREVVRSP